jgi:hypothetical protein
MPALVEVRAQAEVSYKYAILRLAADPAPPLHIAPGCDAPFFARRLARDRIAQDEKWSALSLSTDVAGTSDFAQTPSAGT